MKKTNVELSSADKLTLESMLDSGKFTGRIFKRIAGLVELSRGKTYSEVQTICRLSCVSLGALAKRYRTEGLNCLYDAPRSGRPVKIDEMTLSNALTVLALDNAPDGYSQWSLRLLAEKVVELGHCDHISHTKVASILKKKNLNRTL
jgi:putative transposase